MLAGAAPSTYWPRRGSLAGRHSVVAPPEPVRQSARREKGNEVVTQQG